MDRRSFLTRVRNIGLAIAAGQSGMEMFDPTLLEPNIMTATIALNNLDHWAFYGKSLTEYIKDYQNEIELIRQSKMSNDIFFQSFSATLAER